MLSRLEGILKWREYWKLTESRSLEGRSRLNGKLKLKNATHWKGIGKHKGLIGRCEGWLIILEKVGEWKIGWRLVHMWKVKVKVGNYSEVGWVGLQCTYGSPLVIQDLLEKVLKNLTTFPSPNTSEEKMNQRFLETYRVDNTGPTFTWSLLHQVRLYQVRPHLVNLCRVLNCLFDLQQVHIRTTGSVTGASGAEVSKKWHSHISENILKIRISTNHFLSNNIQKKFRTFFWDNFFSRIEKAKKRPVDWLISPGP